MRHSFLFMRSIARPQFFLLTLLSLLTLPGNAAAENGDFTSNIKIDLDGDQIPDDILFIRFASKPWHELTIHLSTEGKRVRVYSGQLLPNYLLRRACDSGDTYISDFREGGKTLEIYTSIGDLDRGTCGTLHEQRIRIGYRNSELKIIGLEERFAAPKGGDPGFDSRKKARIGPKCPAPTLEQVDASGLPKCLKLGLFEQP